MKRHLFMVVAVLAALATVPNAQMRVVPVDEEQGHVALGLALRHLANTGIYMNADAHPDDENNGLFVMLNRGQGYRTTLATATRGNGGQNEIGPEIFEALGILRTEELAALHRFDGAEQYFTRAVDFGFSFSMDETFEKWGRDDITSDFVHLIRMIRPDVITAMSPNATGGGLHHASSSIIARDAFKFAADPAKYPEQIRDGLRPWQAKKFYVVAGGGPGGPGGGAPGGGAAAANAPAPRVTRCDIGGYDPLLGKTFSEIGTEARSMHKCQGQAQLLALPAPANSQYQLLETAIPGQMDRDEKALFDGVDTTIPGLAKFAGARVPKDLTDGLAALALDVQTAQKKFDTDTDASTLAPLVAGLHAVRQLRGQLRAMAIDETARFEIDYRLRQKEREFQQAALVANGVRVEALADDGVVVPGQPVRVSVIVANHGEASVGIKQIKLDGFDGDGVCTLTPVIGGGGPGGGGRGGRGGVPAPSGPAMTALTKDQIGRCDPTVRIPANARLNEPYWHRAGDAGRYTFDADAPFGLPYRPTPFYAQVTLTFPLGPGAAGGPGSEEVIDGLPVQYRYEGNIFTGEKRTELLVVPAFSVRVSPDIAIIPETEILAASLPSGPSAAAPRPVARGRGTAAPAAAGAARGPAAAPAAARTNVAAADREIRVTVVNDTPGAADGTVKLELPQGWTATPGEQKTTFTRADESQTLRFQVRPAPSARAGEFHIRAVVTAAGQTFDRGYTVIEYPHIRRQHIYDAADVTLKVIDVQTAPNLTVGYIMGVGDQVPPAIQQLGAKVEMIGAEDLAWGNLSRFDAIVTCVRAYERRDDLRANNARLLEYVKDGGTVIVQYNKFEFNQAQYGPYPAQVGAFAGSGARVTDENAPVNVLLPRDPVLSFPNEIKASAWNGWKQERGLYFLGEKDSRYRDLVQFADPFPNNPGDKLGSLVEANYGKGTWVYVGLNLWRQLPAGTEGAYEILANLISLGKAPKPATATPATEKR